MHREGRGQKAQYNNKRDEQANNLWWHKQQTHVNGDYRNPYGLPNVGEGLKKLVRCIEPEARDFAFGWC